MLDAIRNGGMKQLDPAKTALPIIDMERIGAVIVRDWTERR